MLKKTSSNGKIFKIGKHYHVVYFFPDGSGITSEDAGHKHPVKPDKTGKVIVQKVMDHDHDIEEIELIEKKEKVLTDSQIVSQAHTKYKTAKDISSDATTDGEESEEFYIGNQWSAADRSSLKLQKRACLTINEIKPKCDMLSGHQRQNRTDISMLPTEGGDEEAADIINVRIKNICQQNNYDHKETRTFDDMVRVGLGCMRVEIVASKTDVGEVSVSNKYWKNCGFGTHMEMDGRDSEYAYIEENLSMGKLIELYPEKAEEIEKDYAIVKERKKEALRKNDRYTGNGEQLSLYVTDTDSDLVDISKKEYKVIEVQSKVYKRTPILFNARDNFYFNAAGMSDSDINKALKIEELKKIIDVRYHIQITVFAGNVLLSDEKSLFSEINIVPFYANKVGDYWWGKIHEAKDPQIELNKRHSQIIDIINKMCTYGFGFSSEAFETIKDYNDFVLNHNSPGFIAKFAAGFKEHMYEFQGVKYPSEVVASSQLSSEKINTIMNIYPEMLGGSGGAESGIAMAHKQRQGLVGNEYLFDNLSLSKRRVALLIVEAIQIVDSPEKLLRIAENNQNSMLSDNQGRDLYPKFTPEEAIQAGKVFGLISSQNLPLIQQQMEKAEGQISIELKPLFDQIQQMADKIQREKLLKLLANIELTKYDLVVSESQSSPTTMISNYIILSDLFRGRPDAPMEELITLAPGLAKRYKDRIKMKLAASSQAAAKQNEMKYQTEILKTLIKNKADNEQQSGIPQESLAPGVSL